MLICRNVFQVIFQVLSVRTKAKESRRKSASGAQEQRRGIIMTLLFQTATIHHQKNKYLLLNLHYIYKFESIPIDKLQAIANLLFILTIQTKSVLLQRQSRIERVCVGGKWFNQTEHFLFSYLNPDCNSIYSNTQNKEYVSDDFVWYMKSSKYF